MSNKELYASITEEDIERILYEDHEDFESVTSAEIEEQSRWSTYFSQVFKHKNGSFCEVSWGRGSTEQQDFGVESPVIREVEPYEKTVTAYRYVKYED